MKLTKRLANDILLTKTVDPSRLHDMTTRGSNMTEQTQAAACRLRQSWEHATAAQRFELRDARADGTDAHRIYLAELRLAQADNAWRSEMAEATTEVMRIVRKKQQQRITALEVRLERDRLWVTFWHRQRARFVEALQERLQAQRREQMRLAMSLAANGCPEHILREIDARIERIEHELEYAGGHPTALKIQKRAAAAEWNEMASREDYLRACRKLQ